MQDKYKQYMIGDIAAYLPEGITVLDADAFHGCTRLRKVVLPQSLKMISSGSFEFCLSLDTIELPDDLVVIGDNAFGGCPLSSSFSLPNSLKSIGAGAFSCVTGLRHISLPHNLIGLGDGAFYGCGNILSFDIPGSIKHIRANPFVGCHPMSVTSPFYNNGFLVKDGVLISFFESLHVGDSIEIPNTVTTIGSNSFRGCGLEMITIPEGVFRIKRGAFADCSYLKFIDLPKSLEAIEDYAFDSCVNLQYVDIPNDSTRVSDNAFFFCRKLKR